MLAAAALFVAGCYKVKPHGYRELSPITINVPSDTININLGETLTYTGLDIVSAKDVTFQWAYGAPVAGSSIADHKMESVEVISESRTIDYKFPRVGAFILRLRVDNGESISFRYFTLNVNSGYDEGVAILCNDEEGNSSLTFVKTLTSADIAAGSQQVFSNIFSVDGRTLKNGTALHMGHNTYGGETFSGFLIATDDEDGTIYQMNCKTFDLYLMTRMADYGTHCVEFGGEYAEDKASFGSFFRTADGRVFRYDMNGGFLNDMSDIIPFKVDRIIPAITKGSAATAKSTRTPFFFNAETVGTRKTSSAGVRTLNEDGWEVVNVGMTRSSGGYPVNVLFRDKSDPTSYKIKCSSTTFSSWATTRLKDENGQDVIDENGSTITVPVEHTFRTSSLNMDRNSKIISSLQSSDAYYTYGNAIYRWNLISAPGTRPAVTVPEGEIIRDIAMNHLGRTSTAGEDKLYVATYNPSRSGQHKGSLYVYSFTDDSLIAKYEGICDDPASVIYKYRIN